MNYSKEEKEAIEKLEFFKETGYATFMIKYDVDRTTANGMIKRTIETVLNLIQKQDKEIELLSKKLYLCTPEIPQHEHQKYVSYVDLIDKIIKLEEIIDNAINEVEKIRQYFSEDVQVEFIRVLEILKDKNVKDW